MYKTLAVHGEWGQWGQWGACSETCGEGSQKRYRRCDSPRRRHGGRHCRGREVHTKPCVVKECEGTYVIDVKVHIYLLYNSHNYFQTTKYTLTNTE